MAFTGSDSLYTKPYLIDFVNKKTTIYNSEKKNKWYKLQEYLGFLSIFWIPFVVLYLFSYIFIQSTVIDTIFLISFVISHVLICVYRNTSWKWIRDVTMLFEERLYFYKFWKTNKLYLRKTSKVIYNLPFYFKYEMELYGEAKEKIKTIKYTEKNLIVTFKTATEGLIKFRYRGNLKGVKVYNASH